MLFLLWAIINIGLFLFFIFICFRATKFIREKIGLLASIVFVFGLLSFMGHTTFNDENVENTGNGSIKQWKFTSTDSLLNGAFEYKTCVLDKTLISKYILGISYGHHPDTKK